MKSYEAKPHTGGASEVKFPQKCFFTIIILAFARRNKPEIEKVSC